MVRGVLLWMLGLSAAGYLALAGAWFWVLAQRPINYVTLADCILAPLRWEKITHKRGEGLVDEGLAALSKQKWTDARWLLEAGLARAPHYWKGRRSLGLFYFAAGHSDRGAKTLLAGFETYYPGRDALDLVMQLALRAEDYATALSALEKSLTLTGPAVDRDREWIIDQKARVLLLAGEPEACLAWLGTQPELNGLRHETKVVALIQTGDLPAAREALAAWGEGSGTLGGVRRLTVRLEREAGDLAAMRTALAEMRSHSPQSATPWIYSIIQEQMAGQPEAAAAALDAFLMRFGSRRSDVVAAAEPLWQIQAWDLFDRLVKFAEESAIVDSSLLKLQVAAALERGQAAPAKQIFDRYREAQRGTPANAELAWYRVADAWVDLVMEGSAAARERLAVMLRQSRVRLEEGRRMAKALEANADLKSALQVWQTLTHLYPAHDPARQETARIRAVLGELEEPRLIELPAVQDGDELDLEAYLATTVDQLPREFVVALQSSRRFMSLAEKLIEQQSWSELDQLMRELRRARPLWVKAHEKALTNIEIELNLGQRNWPRLLTNVQLQLDGTLPTALEFIKLVRRLEAQGERPTAERVLVEIEKRHLDFPPARRLRADWAGEEEATAE